jgi:quercetin dioxygenase-like cupin family protein
MTIRKPLAVAAVLALGTGLLGGETIDAQTPAFKRTVVQKQDLSVAGREVVQAVAEIPAGVAAGRHTHPGEEIGYVLEGTLTLMVEGKPPVVVKAGEGFFVEAARVHDGKNEGSGTAKIVSTYVVEKGKPLASPAP